MNKVRIPNTVSYMMAVPKNKEEIKTPDAVMYRLKRTKDIHVLEILVNKRTGHPMAIVEYKGKKYNIDFYAETFHIPRGYAFTHRLSPEDMNCFKGEIHGVTTAMTYGENALECYHLQLKFMQCIIPNMAGAVDFNTERIVSGVWLGMAAMSNVTPAPYHVCAVSAVAPTPENKNAWFHTHGLNRCGFCEFEIINGDKERADNYVNMLVSLTGKLIYEKNFPDEKKSVKFNEFSESNNDLYAVWLDWRKAVEYYSEDAAGGKTDRQDNTHNMFVSSLFAYISEKDAESEKVTDWNDVPAEKLKNALWNVPAEENMRVAQLARERIGFLRDGIMLNKDARVLVKLCLPFERNGEKAMEYVWINLHKIDNQKIYGIVETQPVFVASVKKDEPISVEISALADWILYAGNQIVTPDTAYIIVEQLVAYQNARKSGKSVAEADSESAAETMSADNIGNIDDLISQMD